MLVELAAGAAVGGFARVARFGLLGLIGVEAALFAAADAAMGPQAFENQFGGGRGGAGIFAILNAELADVIHDALDFRKLLIAVAGVGEFGQLEFAAQFEPLNDGLEIDVGEMLAEDAADGSANELAGDGVRAFELAFVFELHFSGDGGERSIDIGDAGDDGFFAGAGGAMLGATDEAFHRGDGETLADAGAAVHALVLARLEGDFFDDLAQVMRDFDFFAGVAGDPGFLRGDGHAFFYGGGIVRANFCADTVFERRDDFSAGGVVLGIGGEDEEHVEREADRITLNLDVAFLHDVEEADLNFSGEIGELVDGEDAAIGAGEKTVVDSEFVGKIAAAARGADGIDVADDVGHGDIGRGKFFDETIFARHPGDRRVVAISGNCFAACTADRLERIVIDFAAGDDGHLGVEEVDEPTQDAALGLAAESEKNEIVAREQSVDDLRNDGVFVAVDARKQRFAFFDGAKEIAADFVFHGDGGAPRVEVRDAPEFAECAWFRVSGRLHKSAGRHGVPFREPRSGRGPHKLVQSVSIATGALAHGFPFL